MLTSEIVPLDPGDPVPQRLRKPLPWRWIIAGLYVAGMLVCLVVGIFMRPA